MEAKRFLKIFLTVLAIGLALSFLLEDDNSAANAKDYKEGWSDSTYEKLERMEKLGFSESLATYVIDGCKSKATDPAHCIQVASFIAKAETNCGKTAVNNNVWGFRHKKFLSKEEAFDAWLKRYNLYWHKTKGPHEFYPPKGKTSRTQYCTDERSSGSKVGCPNGLRVATKAYNFIKG